MTKRRPFTGALPELKRGETYYVFASVTDMYMNDIGETNVFKAVEL